MTMLTKAGIVLIAAVAFTSSAAAQRKPAKPSSKKPIAVKAVLPPLDVRVGREHVENQESNVNKFLAILVPIAQDMETLDDTARSGRLSQRALDKIAANKRNLVTTLRELTTGLKNLELEFRTKPSLQKYLQSIEGIGDLGVLAEDSARGGKFVASKEPLLEIVQKLADTLAVMPRYNTALN